MSFSPQQVDNQQYAISITNTTAVPHTIVAPTINSHLRLDPDSVLVGNQTLGEILRTIQEQIALLTPSLELHAEYPELKEIYAQYKEKLAQIQEKQRMWDTLNK